MPQKSPIFLVCLLCISGAKTAGHRSSDYVFSYGVKDPGTGDMKDHWERKNGDFVRGHYSLIDADGTVRSVEYTADDKTGFNAIVKRNTPKYDPLSQPVQVQYYHHYGLFEEEKENSKQPEDDNSNQIKQTYFFIPEDNDNPKSKTELPIDLSLIKTTNNNEKLIPIDVDLLNPIEIILKPPNYFKQFTLNRLNQLEFETGFKNNYGRLKNSIIRPVLPVQTFKSSEKPITTPGLGNFATRY